MVIVSSLELRKIGVENRNFIDKLGGAMLTLFDIDIDDETRACRRIHYCKDKAC